MYSIRPLAISQHLNLSGFNSLSLEIEARFNHGIIAIMHHSKEPPNTVFVSTRQKGLVPHQIIVTSNDFDRLSMESEFKINITEVKKFSLCAPSINVNHLVLTENLQRLGEFLLNETSGLGDLNKLQNQLPLVEMALSYQTDDPNWESAVKWLIGRGLGSTPSGDDILQGALCVQYVLEQKNAPLWRCLNQNLALYTSLTTALSAEYFEAAMQGLFASKLLQVAKALLSKTSQHSLSRYLNNMRDVGAHSGIDGLFGVFLVLNLINHKSNVRGGFYANRI